MSDSPKQSTSRITHLTMRIPPKLRDAIKAYAERHETTISKLTLDYYRKLLSEETPQEAEQI